MSRLRSAALPGAAVLVAAATALVIASTGHAAPPQPVAPRASAPSAGERLADRAAAARLALAERSVDQLAADRARGVLDGRRVLLVIAAGARDADVRATARGIAAAGAELSGTVALTAAYGAPTHGRPLERLVTDLVPSGVRLPTTRTPTSVAGAVLGRAFTGTRGTDAATVTSDAQALAVALTKAGYARTSGTPWVGASAAVVVAGPTPAAGITPYVDLVAGLRAHGPAVVVAAPRGSAAGGGLVAAVRRSGPTGTRAATVDALDTAAGRWAVPLALAEALGGKAGDYGDGPGASAPLPKTAAAGVSSQ